MAAPTTAAAGGGPLAGRHALVTGAARGIGAAIARMLVLEGAHVTLLGRDPRRLTDTAAVLSAAADGAAARVRIATADVADEEAVRATFDAARDDFGPVAILVNNAGQAESAPFAKTSLALWQKMLAVNLTGSFLCCRAALPQMLALGHGRIVNIASTAGQRGYPYVAAYVAAKHGVVGLTRALATELAKKPVTVNAVCPGYTETDILKESIANVVAKTGRTEAEARASFATSNPQGRIIQPDEVADVVRWLCGDAAASITGQAISVSGGEVM